MKINDEIKIANQPLIDALKAFADQPSMDTERAIYLALQQCVFLMPAVIKSAFRILDDRIVDVDPGTTMKVVQVQSDDGQLLYPAFTSLEELDNWNVDLSAQDIYLVNMPMPRFVALLESDDDPTKGMVINPYHQNLALSDIQIERYSAIQYEEANKDALTAPLTRLMDQLREASTPELETKIYRLFQHIRFLMPITIEDPSGLTDITDEGVASLEDNTSINVTPLENEDGEQLFPVFTDLYQAKRSGIGANEREHRYLIEINFEGVESLVNHNPAVIGFAVNPFDHNIILSKEQFVYYHELKGDAMPINRQSTLHASEDDHLVQQLRTTPEQEAAVLSQLVDRPHQYIFDVSHKKLEKRLIKEMKVVPSVIRAYLAKKSYHDCDAYVVVVEKERDGKSIFADLKDKAMQVLADNETIELISHNEDEAASILEHVPPFYDKTKKKSLFGRH